MNEHILHSVLPKKFFQLGLQEATHTHWDGPEPQTFVYMDGHPIDGVYHTPDLEIALLILLSFHEGGWRPPNGHNQRHYKFGNRQIQTKSGLTASTSFKHKKRTQCEIVHQVCHKRMLASSATAATRPNNLSNSTKTRKPWTTRGIRMNRCAEE
jgi:hypothetical protein